MLLRNSVKRFLSVTSWNSMGLYCLGISSEGRPWFTAIFFGSGIGGFPAVAFCFLAVCIELRTYRPSKPAIARSNKLMAIHFFVIVTFLCPAESLQAAAGISALSRYAIPSRIAA
jgi:hypothetical protein